MGQGTGNGGLVTALLLSGLDHFLSLGHSKYGSVSFHYQSLAVLLLII